MRLLLAFVMFIASLWLTGCATYDSARQVDRNLTALSSAPSNLQAAVDQLAKPLIESGESHSLSIGVLTTDGTTHHFGYAPDDESIPAKETIFEIGSVTKPFVAALLAILVQEGTLNYEDTVREILPSHVHVSDSIADVTLFELATHTSGLPLHPQPVAKWPYFLDFAFSGRNPYRYITRPYLYRYLRTCKVPPRSERHYDYSNIGYGLLGHLIEVKTGRSLPELMTEKIFIPLGMRDTTFTLTKEQRQRLARGHAGDEPTFIRRNRPMSDWDMGEIMRASGGLYSTASDLLRFAQANLGMAGQPIANQLATTHEILFETPLQGITLAWAVERMDGGRSSTISRIGVVGGYCAYFGMDTEKRVAVAVLGNNFNWTDKVGHKLLLRLGETNAISSLASGPRSTAPEIAR